MNQDKSAAVGSASSGKVDRNIENLLTAAKSTKSKKPKLTKIKKSDFI